MQDIVGCLAALCVLTSASVERLDWLRYASLLSNVLFISYALLEGLLPVLAMHAILLPINAGKSFRHFQRTRRIARLKA